jgi:hypothetical protein
MLERLERLRQWLIEWPDVSERPRPAHATPVDKPRRARSLPKRLERVRDDTSRTAAKLEKPTPRS